ncbi:MAG: sigma-70 family RNA polymerase sigma factor, partial [Pseudomonadota bacterium]
ARRGDSAAYESLLREAAEMMRAMVRARLGAMGFGPEEVEDVVQEALIALHVKRDTWDAERPITPWIRAIARYRMLDAARSLGRSRRRAHDRPVEEMADRLAAPAGAPHGAARDAETLVARLPARERGVVEALSLDGMSVAGAAARLSISEGSVRVAFHRGLARLSRLAADPADAAAKES